MAELARRVDEDEESAHGRLSPVDQKYTGERFVAMIFGTLATALVIIYLAASFNPDTMTVNLGWQGWGLAHDPIKHSLESSTMDLKLH